MICVLAARAVGYNLQEPFVSRRPALLFFQA